MNETKKECVGCKHLEIVCGGGNCHNKEICNKVPQNLPKADAYFLLAEVRAMQCCGNCYYMDIVIDKGGICTFGGEEISCDRNGYCEDWKLNPKD